MMCHCGCWSDAPFKFTDCYGRKYSMCEHCGWINYPRAETK